MTKSAPLLPELILRRVVFETGLLQTGLQLPAVHMHILAKRVERGIIISQFRIDNTEKHHHVSW